MAQGGEASGWAGPAHESGAGYGIRIPIAFRDRHFQRGWRTVELSLGDTTTITVTVASSFWRSCNHLNSAAIGRWMMSLGVAPWPKGNPPRMRLTPVGERHFRVDLNR